MDAENPLVTIIVATFNRAHTIVRAVNSVLNQSYKNIELIIIDDGSTDNTLEILSTYKDPRIRIYKHEINRGVTAAKNSGLKQIKGQWFTIFDSDDEMKPEAVEEMIRIPLLFDPAVTAVTCNCWDTTTKDFTGKGLKRDQYTDVNTLMTVCKDIFWGITKTDLLENDTFNERLYGFESTLWYKIDDRANRYYIHKVLNIVYTDGDDRITKSKTKYNFKKEIVLYENLITEEYYLNKIKRYRPGEYYIICRTGLTVMKAVNNEYLAAKYYELLKTSKSGIIINLIYKYRSVSLIIKYYKMLKFFLKPFIYGLLKK